MIQENFLHIQERDTFESLKENIRDKSLTFIKETGTLFHKGKEFLQPRWKEIGEPTPRFVTTLTLDQSISDPTKMVTGPFGKDGTPEDNIVTWIRSQSHRYVGTYDANEGMLLKQLDDNDSTKYADGSDASADITGANGGDVFMKMPDFWFKGVQVEVGNENKWNILFRAVEPKDEGWTKWDGNNLIGAYKAYAEDSGNNSNGNLRSISGVTPSVSITQPNFKTKARNRSNGDDHFMIVTYEAHQVMALLYMCYYGNMNGQSVIGAGTSKYPKVTGQTYVDGMNDTIKENNRSINFWGLENWWGDLYEWVDNLMTYNTSGGINIFDYDGGTVRQVTGETSDNEISKMLLGESLDIIPTDYVSNVSYNTYYCDYGRIYTNTGQVACRSYYEAYAHGGPFFLFMTNTPANFSSTYGSRLQYHGRVTILK